MLPHHEQRVADRAFDHLPRLVLVGWRVDQLAVDDHRRRSAAIKVESLVNAELDHQAGEFGKRHAVAPFLSTIDGDQIEGAAVG
jgi:hypothetical protein